MASKNTVDRLKVKCQEKINHVNINKRKAEVAITADKVDFRIREIIRDLEGHNIMIKGSIQKEDRANLYMYAQNNRAPKT